MRNTHHGSIWIEMGKKNDIISESDSDMNVGGGHTPTCMCVSVERKLNVNKGDKITFLMRVNHIEIATLILGCQEDSGIF